MVGRLVASLLKTIQFVDMQSMHTFLAVLVKMPHCLLIDCTKTCTLKIAIKDILLKSNIRLALTLVTKHCGTERI